MTTDPVEALRTVVDDLEDALSQEVLDRTRMEGDVALLRARVEMLEQERTTFVTLTEFWPVKKIVYGVVGATLFAAMTALLALIIRSPGGGQ